MKITDERRIPVSPSVKQGDILKTMYESYIVARVDARHWNLINLETGNRFCDARDSIDSLVTFFRRARAGVEIIPNDRAELVIR